MSNTEEMDLPLSPLWDQLPAGLLLRGERDGWGTILKDVQRHFNDNVYMPVCT